MIFRRNTPVLATPDDDGDPPLRPTALAGIATIVVAFGGFFGWAYLAPLNSAAIASGVVMVDSHRKTVQHLEGGILKELLVREGDIVKAGQVLVRLDGTLADATFGQIRGQQLAALARVTRLRAEQIDARGISFPAELTNEAGDPSVADIIKTEERLFFARWESYDGQSAVQRKRIAQFNEEIAALQSQAAASGDRLTYTEEQLNNVRGLVEKGFERRPRLLELQSQAAEHRGKRGEYLANIARARQAIAGAEQDILNLQNQRRTDVTKELQDSQTLLADLTDRLRAATDIVQRKDVVAPQDGLITDLKFFTTGGVIAPGAPILDIVPLDDNLIVEAHVSPGDIDVVRVGLPAFVRLTAYKQHRVPPIAGTVIYVSADKLVDQRNGEPYFTARVRLSPQSLAELKRVELYPGMPAEVMMVTGERRAIDYFVAPITDSMRRAFREE
jgi:HlyD family secretion protein